MLKGIEVNTEETVKAEKTKKHAARFKIPFIDWYIVSGVDLREDDKKIEKLERDFQGVLKSSKNSSRMLSILHYRLAVMTGKLKAPECPKCGKPKIPGGIQWLDHAKCKEKGKSKKEKVKI